MDLRCDKVSCFTCRGPIKSEAPREKVSWNEVSTTTVNVLVSQRSRIGHIRLFVVQQYIL